LWLVLANSRLNPFSRIFSRTFPGALFRGRYKTILIDAEEYFLSVVRYIHKNPLSAGMISNIDRYRWSSHWGYLNQKQCPDWLDTRSVMSRFVTSRVANTTSLL
jgi:hypothetical protein